MQKDLKQALELLENIHATVWVHFDPDMDQGDKLQPKDIRKMLLEIRAFCRAHGVVMEGWKR